MPVSHRFSHRVLHGKEEVLSMKSRLLEALKIGSMTVKNGVFMAPMSL